MPSYSSYLDKMNSMQRKAIEHIEGPLLILAGAGSGKTTVLVSRIANIIDKGAAAPWEILAITFTNKAANELKSRLALYLGEETASGVWAGTFHSICVRILRRYADRIGYTSRFTIYDTDDSKRVMKECQRLLGIDDKILPHKVILSVISQAKDHLISVSEFKKSVKSKKSKISGSAKSFDGPDIRMEKIAECYKLYQQLLLSADAMDFDDIIVNAVKLLQKDEEVRSYYQRKFRYVHVDEYQDTNHAQYVLTSLFAGGYDNLCVVGDDDQSIYKFRGATIENILSFEKNYKDACVIRLEENYRSTGNILSAANEVIKNNKERKGKNLWTSAGDGELLTLYTAESEIDEGRFIADEIATGVANGRKFSDYAVLYRVNAQSNAIERAFVRMGIPYQILSGHRFYERKEIRDAIAYLTLVVNPSDAIKLKRVVNVPKRGIGDTTVNLVADIAAGLGISMFEVMTTADQYDRLGRTSAKLIEFTKMINSLRERAEEVPMYVLFDDLMEVTGYKEALFADQSTYEDRNQNLEELKSNMVRFLEENEGGNLGDFLEEVALLSDIDSYNTGADGKAEKDTVVMMTLHSAKGLEFPVVFIIGMEEGIFPGKQSLYDPKEVEEERRLAYVGITRAKEKLYLTNADYRMLYGSTVRNMTSRFVNEIPEEFLEEAPKSVSVATVPPKKYARSSSTYNIGAKKSVATTETYAVGDTVKHKAFGTGVIVSVSPMGNDCFLEVAFNKAGTKKLMANFAKLEKL
ncbi:MAG: UvrD-helicase domain-containing protein [Ruminococcaceae bacterium]|nr:UvrD-helicase domain-containing protein [Oscillospiraceae bacterium]